jgi:flavodoxin I
MKAKIIYGSDTGNTEVIAEDLVKLLDKPEVLTVDELEESDWESNELYILGIPTWYDGELQSDWEDYLDDFQKIDFTGKTVAVFGLGDQVGYAEWFCDGVGILADIVEKNGGKVIGNWPTDGYEFESSKAVMNTNNTFFGLCLDEDNQPELTQERLKKWVEQLKIENNGI